MTVPPRIFRPAITVLGDRTYVLLEQAAAVPVERLGDVVGHLARAELDDVSAALRLVLELD
ncbi:MAG: type II toxin-antitoxin system PemK/MazF family toxin [Jatrophihabitantaceae bacterium]